ncbi:MAG: DUF1156 domain-containing protein [Lactobacillales bacterium]|jgi:putative DNA methylase|nr:DUF1156 domain-containing protein [Lactobacillales bacterium]
MKKKLIEVGLPLEAINLACAREKSIHHNHPSSLHLWWARRPLAAARAVIFASLIDDPSSHPEIFPLEEQQNAERDRLFDIIKSLVKYENIHNITLLNSAITEISNSLNGHFPKLLDPFCGGGSIPLEGKKLGLEVFASDLNPVSVIINFAMLDFPHRFANAIPVNPDYSSPTINQKFVTSSKPLPVKNALSLDLEFYANSIYDKLHNEIGHLYPPLNPETLEFSNRRDSTTNIIAWIWFRAVKCPNPVCNCQTPLAHSFNLCTVAGKEKHLVPIISDTTISFKIAKGKTDNYTVNKHGAKCIKCNAIIPLKYIQEEGVAGKLTELPGAIVADISKTKEYYIFDDLHFNASLVPRPEHVPETLIPNTNHKICTKIYGFSKFSDHFTNRQLTLLSAFSTLISDIGKQIQYDAEIKWNNYDDTDITEGGTGSKAYSQAIQIYLSLILDKTADYNSSFSTWNAPRQGMRNIFGRQSLPMVWDFAEVNPFSNQTGSIKNMIQWVVKTLETLDRSPISVKPTINLRDAKQDSGLRNMLISTDPPYYDNIIYSDISDFFYVWLRLTLHDIIPNLFQTVLTPKRDEIVANKFRHDNNPVKAKLFFEKSLYEAFVNLYNCSSDEYPVTIYYAFKQREFKEINHSESNISTRKIETTSSGWETMLSALIKAGFSITGTWPIKTEFVGRNVGNNTNSLSTSIVLVCRKRPQAENKISTRDFIKELSREISVPLKYLQNCKLSPVDLAQAAIGPGMAIFTKYSKIIESDNSELTVRKALSEINNALDRFLSESTVGLDLESSFCIELYSQYSYNSVLAGEADILLKAKNVTLQSLLNLKVIKSKDGKISLNERDELDVTSPQHMHCIWLNTQLLVKLFIKGGIDDSANFLNVIPPNLREKSLSVAYKLFSISENHKWIHEAKAYNSFVTDWDQIKNRAIELESIRPKDLF